MGLFLRKLIWNDCESKSTEIGVVVYVVQGRNKLE